MRPIELTISAFGSYKGTETIDFNKLGAQGVFLISGETGAGKTTIFDAICYALFGEASGNSRDGKMLRSEYAAPTDRTFVKMKFEYAGKEYTIERWLAYARPSGRRSRNEFGELVDGTTGVKAGATLEIAGEPTISDINAVNEKIANILGINYKQFTKIGMLPQGEFQKLLQDNNEEKKQILRQIFKTERFNNIAFRINEDAKALDGKSKDKEKAIRTHLETVRGDESSEKYVAFRGLMDEYEDPVAQLEGVLEAVREIIAEDKAIEADSHKQREEFYKQETEQKLRRQKVVDNETNKVARVRKQGELEKLNAALSPLQEDLAKNEKRAQNRDAAVRRQKEIELELPKYKEADALQKELINREKELAKAKDILARNITRRDALSKEIVAAENEQKSLAGCDVKRADVERAGKDVRTLLDKIAQAETEQKNYAQAVADHNSIEKDAADILNAKKEANQRYTELSTLFLMSQAGIMAQALEDGKACPVCGSIHHPVKAELAADAPTQEAVNKAKKASDEADLKAQAASNRCAQSKGKLEEFRATITKAAEELAKEQGGKDKATLEAERNALLEQYKLLDNQCKRLADLNISLPKKRTEVAALNEAIQKDNSQAQESVLKVEKAKLETIRKGLAFENEAKANEEIARQKQIAANFQKAIEAAIKNESDCRNNISAAKAAIEQLSKQIDEKLESDLKVIDDAITAAMDGKVKAEKKYTAAASRLSINEPALTKVKAMFEAQKELLKELAWKQNIAKTICGGLNGKQRIELETYAQMEYFRRILYKASQRMIMMSNGQYELVREEQAENLNSKTGLGICVLDHYSGKTRSVKSLSGGETFLASLALALGLSDETQSSAGGVKIDTMFIDEGFGSLSPDVLKLALKTLQDLADKGTLIGLISHVEGMKDLYQRIDVIKTPSGGSTIVQS